MVSWVVHKGNKYGAKRTEYGGEVYDSRFEAGVALDLDLRRKAKDIAKVERQVTFPFVVNGIKVGQWRADFVITHNDGTREVVEAKGFETFLFKLKWNLMQALYPDYKLTLVRQHWMPRRGGGKKR